MNFKCCVVRGKSRKGCHKNYFSSGNSAIFNRSDITEREDKQACFDVEKPESHVKRRVVPCVGFCIPVSITPCSEKGHRICAYLLPGVTPYTITSFGLGMKELESSGEDLGLTQQFSFLSSTGLSKI